MSVAPLKILFVGAELEPLVKVGGLADVMGSLPRALAKQGLDIKIIIPFYANIDRKKFHFRLKQKNISLDLDSDTTTFDLYQSRLPNSNIVIWLIKHRLFDYPDIYLGQRKYLQGRSYTRSTNDIERFTFFSKAVAELIRQSAWKPDVVHCHDWHTALVPTFIDEYSLEYNSFPNISTLFTIHNLANQGVAGLDLINYANLHHDWTPALMEDYYDRDGDVVDLIKIGILSADQVSTVSPTYAREILSKQFGESLEKYLQRRRHDLSGILNGLDWKFFDPAHDKFIKKNYSRASLDRGKAVNKLFLQKKIGLSGRASVPLFSLVSRLVKQKGLDILLPALKNILAKNDLQIVILGNGEPLYEKQLKKLAQEFSQKLKVIVSFDAVLAQQIYAGSDFFLMPSQFEPCGLGQMIAQRYGSIPVARQTGGLKDTISNNQTGLLFRPYQSQALLFALSRAVKLYQNKNKFYAMRKRIMKIDHSWSASAKEYIKIYKKLS
ncbi:MAG: hypothetical protein C3F02_01970 [Parcubacteria group bacterium]|nr:MAG: hypothetical protein C3F02_01970 [Parcubacteria group bacterium]